MSRPKKRSDIERIKELEDQLRYIKKLIPPKEMGRPTVFDEKKIKNLTSLCKAPWITEQEVCDALDITISGLEKFLRRKYDMTFSEFKNKNVGSFKVWLWGKQIDLVNDKHPGVTIFLGKNYLGQTDKQETITTNQNSEPAKLIIKMAND